MKIVQIIHSLRRGGAERVCLQLAGGLKKKGHEVTVLSLYRNNDYGELIQAHGLRHIGLHDGDENGLSRDFFRLVRRLRREVAIIAPDIVHVHLPTAALVAFFAWRRAQVFTIHSTKEFFWGQESLSQKVLCLLSRIAMKKSSTSLVAVSGDSADAYRRFYHLEKEVRVVKNGVDTEMFSLGERGSGRVQDLMTRIIMVGTLCETKNQKMALHAMQLLKLGGHNVQLTVVGDGPQKDELIALAKKLGVEREVVFAGQRKDVKQLMGSSDLFWHTSRYEGLPMVLLEAMAMKLPVICTDIDGVKQICRHEESALLAAVDDCLQLASHTELVISRPAFAEQMALNAHALVMSSYTNEQMVCGYERLYREMHFKADRA